MNIANFTFRLHEIKQENLISVTFLDPRTKRQSPTINVVLWGAARQKLKERKSQDYVLVRGILSQRNNVLGNENSKIYIHALTLDFLH